MFVADVYEDDLRARDDDCCSLCGWPLDPDETPHLEHSVPLSRGGAHEPMNCGLAHPACNLSKGHADPKEFIPAWMDLHDPLRPPWLPYPGDGDPLPVVAHDPADLGGLPL